MTLKTKPFEFSKNIESKEDTALYLSIFLEENGIDGLTQALQYLAKSKGISCLAEETKLNRQSLYKVLSCTGKPKFETINKIIHALGFKLTIEPI